MIRIRRIRANNFKQLQEIDLYLPPQGRFLVQGRNEAGKSTLFEAVFFGIFGIPLVTETGTRRLDDLIRYGVEQAYVELWLEAPDRLLKVRRTVVRDKPNRWELDIESPRGIEEVRSNRQVNSRIIEELGFDAEALLNTAFVEQKKLDKLEGMGRSQREQSLMKLLNLEQMTHLENEFRLRGEDRLALQRSQQRAELASVQAELPQKQHQLTELEQQLLHIELRRSLEATLDERAAVARLSKEVADLVTRQADLADRVRQAEQLRNGLQTAREIYGLRERAGDLALEIERTAQEAAAAERLRDERLPALAREQEALQMLRDRLVRMAELEATYQSRQATIEDLTGRLRTLQETGTQLADAQAREHDLRLALRDAEEQLNNASYLINAYRVREALQAWCAAQEQLEAPGRQASELAKARDQHRLLAHRLQQEAAAIGAGIALAVVLTWVASSVAFMFAIIAIGLLGLLLWRAWEATSALSDIAEQAGQLEGEQWVLETTAEQNQAQADAAEKRLQDLNVVIPSRRERAQQAIAELDDRLENRSLPTLQAAADAARERLARTQALLEESVRELRRLRQTLDEADVPARQAELRAARHEASALQGALQSQHDRSAKLAQALGLEMDLGGVQGRLGALENERRNVERQLAAAEQGSADLAHKQQALNELWNRIETLYDELSDIGVAIPIWDRDHAAEVITAAGQALRRAYEEAGGDQLRQELQQLQTAIGRKEGERKTRNEQAARHLARVRSALQQLALADEFPDDPSDADLAAWLDRVRHAEAGDAQALRTQIDALRERVGYLREQEQALKNTLGLQDETLDVEETRKALQIHQRELQVRQKAQEIVELARRRVVEQILPSTMEHMRKVLPTLTMQRYYDAELTDDYRIRVWDERAGQTGDWKEKNIFSGGTKDQLSLALRLAFALATLPEERGSAPSFIFLDEPLGSFDDERARALLHLLTEGEIAKSFDQIFLISHVRVNPGLFNYHITVDQGHIVESDLPEAEGGVELPMMESVRM